jgi:hypothetical protein
MAEDTMAPSSGATVKSNWVVGIVAGILAALVGAFLHAFIIGNSSQGLEIRPIALVISFLAGFALSRVGKVSGPIAGLVAAVIGFVAWAFAVELGAGWWMSKQGYGSIFGNFADIFPHSWDVLKSYFQDNAIGYVWVLAAAVIGFVVASGIRRKSA